MYSNPRYEPVEYQLAIHPLHRLIDQTPQHARLRCRSRHVTRFLCRHCLHPCRRLLRSSHLLRRPCACAFRKQRQPLVLNVRILNEVTLRRLVENVPSSFFEVARVMLSILSLLLCLSAKGRAWLPCAHAYTLIIAFHIFPFPKFECFVPLQFVTHFVTLCVQYGKIKLATPLACLFADICIIFKNVLFRGYIKLIKCCC